MFYAILLGILGLVVGFSPALYGLTLYHVSTSSRQRTVQLCMIVAGVATGVVVLFVLGGHIAVMIDSLRLAVTTHRAVVTGLLALAGGLLVLYSVWRQYAPRRIPKARSTAFSFSTFLFALFRTTVSASSIAAMLVIASALTSRDLSWTMVNVVILPFATFAAVAPYLFFITNKRVARTIRRFTSQRLRVVGYRVAQYKVALPCLTAMIGFGLIIVAAVRFITG